MIPTRTTLVTAGVVAGLVALNAVVGSVDSQGAGAERPRGSVRMVVPFGAGGGSDASGRAMATGLEQVNPSLSITTENRDGGSGAVGYAYFMSKQGSPNYLLATETALLALPLSTSVPFDYTSFTPIMKLADDFTLAVVRPDSPWKTCADVVNAAERGKVVVGVSGSTSLDNVVFTMAEKKAGVRFNRVPFESGDEVLSGLLGNQIQLASMNPSEVVGQLKAGRLRALCAFADKRYTYPELKDVPTAKEQGLDVSYAQFRGLIAPGGISDGAQRYWVSTAREFGQSKPGRDYVAQNYLQPNVLYGDDFGAYLAASNRTLKAVLGR